VYATTGGGTSPYASSIIALERRTLKLRDRLQQDAPFTSPPVIFSEGEKTYLAAVSASGLYVLDAGSLGGADHRTPLTVAAEPGARFSGDGVATWRDAANTRWILTEANGAIVAFKIAPSDRRPVLERVWISRTMPSPRVPIIVNDVVFALASGSAGGNAVLYALDPATGKDLWNSGSTMTAPASAGLSAGTGQVHVVTTDNTVWAFGIPLAIE
jgi:outer membrane protein assembly factor BamB